MHGLSKKAVLIACSILLSTWVSAQEVVPMNDSTARAMVQHKADSLLNGLWFVNATGYQKRDSTRIRKVELLRKPMRIRLYADSQLAYAPFREEMADSLLNLIGSGLTEPYSKYPNKLELVLKANHSKLCW